MVLDRSSLDSPLAGMMVVLASENRENDEFKQVWLDVLEAAGCNVLTRLPPPSSRSKHSPSLMIHVHHSQSHRISKKLSEELCQISTCLASMIFTPS